LSLLYIKVHLLTTLALVSFAFALNIDKMLLNTFTITSLFIATALGAAEPKAMPYKLAKMSFNEAFGLVGRQNAGYAPTQTYCSAGTDCPTACGANTVQCPSTDGDLHCFTPSEGQACCPDGYGNACDEGYYCTDNSDGTWCCPNGTSLSDCAALYGVSSLTSEAVPTTTAPSSTSPTSVAASVTYSSSSSSSAYVAPTSSKITAPSSPSASLPTYSASSNGTATTSSAPLQVTGAANKVVKGALPALAMAAGAVFVL